MSENARTDNNFIAYEYKEVTVRRDIEPLYVDSLPSFGWKLEGSALALGFSNITLKFKRNRKIVNKAELTRLQREYDGHIKEIEKLEDAKLTAPSVVAYTIGLIGTAVMAGATFGYLAGNIVLCVILGVIGFAGWGAAYLAYLRVKKSKAEQVTPLIDRQYDAIYEICERANSLVNA